MMREGGQGIAIKPLQLWKENQPIAGSCVAVYLAGFGYTSPVPPPSLGYHPRLWNEAAREYMPAMLAFVMSGGNLVGVHCTFLGMDKSKKAIIKKGEGVIGNCDRGYVQLDNHASQLVIAEGVEAALALKAAQPWLYVWAAVSPKSMETSVPKSVRDLTLYADLKNPARTDQHLNELAFAHSANGRMVQTLRHNINDSLKGEA